MEYIQQATIFATRGQKRGKKKREVANFEPKKIGGELFKGVEGRYKGYRKAEVIVSMVIEGCGVCNGYHIDNQGDLQEFRKPYVTGSEKRYIVAHNLIFLYKRCCSKTRNIFYSLKKNFFGA